jgi:hypothetical protein
MTIQVHIKHGDGGHPAPVFVTPINPDTQKPSGPTVTVKDGGELTKYVHSGQSLLIGERHPDGGN